MGPGFPAPPGGAGAPSSRVVATAASPLPAATKPDTLQRASVGIIDQKACSALYSFPLTDRMLCAGFLEGQVDSCQVARRGPRAPGGPQSQRRTLAPAAGRAGGDWRHSGARGAGEPETSPASRNA